MQKSPIVILSAFYRPFSSGAELCVEEMVGRRDKRDLLIITSRLSRKSLKLDADQGVRIIRVGFGYSWDKFLYPFLCIWPTLQAKPKVVHAVMESYAGIGLVLLKWIKPSLRTILTLQSGNLDIDPKLAKGPMAWLWKKIHTTPDRVTAISGFLAKRAAVLRGSESNVSVIPNGVDIEAVKSQKLKVESRVPGRIVCISRLSREKGVDVLVKAFAKVAQEVPNSELHIVGDGPDRDFVESLIAENNLQSRIKLYGRRPHTEAIGIVSTGQIFVLLSRGEGQGIVLLEAAAAGLPCVATNVGGIPEAMIDGVTGYLVPNEAFDAAAVRIIELLRDTGLRERMGQAAEEFVQGFEWTACIAKYQELWVSLEKSMRLVIATGIYPPDIGGPAGYSKRLAEALVERGHEVSVVTYGDRQTSNGLKRIMHKEIFKVKLVSRKGLLLSRLIRFAWAVWRSAKNVDFVYAQSPIADGAPALLAARLRGVRFVLKTVGDYAWEQYMNQDIVGVPESLEKFIQHHHDGKLGLLESTERFISKRADLVISPSEYFKNNVLSVWGVDAKRVCVVRNGIKPFQVISTAPVANGLSLNKRSVVFTAGRAIALKRVDFLLSLLVDLPDHELVIAGSGPCLESWKIKSGELKIADRVKWVGDLDREGMAHWYQASDIFALASSHETFPHVLIEAASCGLPCVASRVGGIPEIAKYFSGHIVTLLPDDRAAWLAALRVAQRQSSVGLPEIFTLQQMVAETERTLQLVTNI